MPHATDNVVNGEKSSSQFISHLTSYPAVSDSIETFKSNPYGRKSLELIDGAYSRFAKPVEPYLETPYAYAKPYAKKADELADSGLSRVEKQFPIVKEDTGKIVDTAINYATWPYTYLSSTWNDEYSKTAKRNGRGPGLSTSVLAIVSTEIRIAADFFHAVADFLGPKFDESKKTASDYAKQAEGAAHDYKEAGKEKLGQAQKTGEDKLNQASKATEDKANHASNVAEEKKDHVKHEAHRAHHEVHKKTTK